MLRACALGTVLLTCLTWSGTANATSLKDVQIAVRVVDFLIAPPPARSVLAILYDPRVKDSLDDAHAIELWLKDEAVSSKTSLVPQLVDVHNLEEIEGFRIGFLAAGTEASYGAVHDYARKHRVLTISSDITCAKSGKCTIGISSRSRVEVIVNRQVSQDCGIAFTEAFRMMVTEF